MTMYFWQLITAKQMQDIISLAKNTELAEGTTDHGFSYDYRTGEGQILSKDKIIENMEKYKQILMVCVHPGGVPRTLNVSVSHGTDYDGKMSGYTLMTVLEDKVREIFPELEI